MKKPPIKIELKEYDYACGDGCCYSYGVVTIVDGVELPDRTVNTKNILEQLLKHLEIDAEVTEIYDTDLC
jgi:hypothetical protein